MQNPAGPSFPSFVCHWLIMWLRANCLCEWLISTSVSMFIKVWGVINISLAVIHFQLFVPFILCWIHHIYTTNHNVNLCAVFYCRALDTDLVPYMQQTRDSILFCLWVTEHKIFILGDVLKKKKIPSKFITSNCSGPSITCSLYILFHLLFGNVSWN